jgi:hypothetical protein
MAERDVEPDEVLGMLKPGRSELDVIEVPEAELPAQPALVRDGKIRPVSADAAHGIGGIRRDGFPSDRRYESRRSRST